LISTIKSDMLPRKTMETPVSAFSGLSFTNSGRPGTSQRWPAARARLAQADQRVEDQQSQNRVQAHSTPPTPWLELERFAGGPQSPVEKEQDARRHTLSSQPWAILAIRDQVIQARPMALGPEASQWHDFTSTLPISATSSTVQQMPPPATWRRL
jgi:hypothetical protein